MPDTYDDAELRKHDVSRDEVDQVMRSYLSVWLPLPASRRGHERAMIVGFTDTGRLLEIGAELIPPNDDLHFFHGADATKAYRQAFEEHI